MSNRRFLKTLFISISVVGLISCGGISGTGNDSSTGLNNIKSITVVSVSVAPNPTTTGVGYSSNLTALANFSDGSQQDVTQAATWSSSNTKIAVVTTSGVVNGISSGNVTITATYNNESGNSRIIINPISTLNIWRTGSNTINSPGIYGTQGMTSPLNTPGGRWSAAVWAGNESNIWLFGGGGYGVSDTPNRLNGLWKYNLTSNQWTWMQGESSGLNIGIYGTQGVASSSNIPGGRNLAAAWKDKSGNLWLFGGWGYDSIPHWNILDDLWKYDPNTNQWTWVKGKSSGLNIGTYGTQGVASSSNMPGGRANSSVWVDEAGNFWLFGGFGWGDGTGPYSQDELNDLWKYNPNTNQWTWVSGTSYTDSKGIYGVKGVSSSSNMPGARDGSSAWVDKKGNFWLFGGKGYGSSSSSEGALNDLWKYNPTTNQWTWVSGESSVNSSGRYGTKGTVSSSNMPGARVNASSWIDKYGNLWLFGGGFYIPNQSDSLNDLWEYNLTTNQWTWVSGESTINQPGVYKTQGMPGARRNSSTWVDAHGNFWLFGGWGYDSTGTNGRLNDMWQIQTR